MGIGWAWQGGIWSDIKSDPKKAVIVSLILVEPSLRMSRASSKFFKVSTVYSRSSMISLSAAGNDFISFCLAANITGASRFLFAMISWGKSSCILMLESFTWDLLFHASWRSPKKWNLQMIGWGLSSIGFMLYHTVAMYDFDVSYTILIQFEVKL